MIKRHIRVLCLRRNKRGLAISSGVRSPNNLRRGMWSVMMIRLSHPWVKYLVCSRDQPMASASPSTGAYLDSADLRKREPANVILHPSSQQLGDSCKQLQCFCERKKPIPVVDQSGRRHVWRRGSKISTPFLDGFDYMVLGLLKCEVEVGCPFKPGLGTEQAFKWLHDG